MNGRGNERQMGKKQDDEDEIFRFFSTFALGKNRIADLTNTYQIMKHSSVLLAVVLCLAGAKALAHDIEVPNADGVTIYYNYINNGSELAVTAKGSTSSANYSYKGDVVIPDEVTFMNRTRKVTRIGDRAFYTCTGLTSVDIPHSVTAIGQSAFQQCTNLTTVRFHMGLTSIENYAFSYCGKLATIGFPSTLTSIGVEAFYRCGELERVSIPRSLTTVGLNAFRDCKGLTAVFLESIDAWCNIDFSNDGANPLFYAQRLFCNGGEVTSVVIPHNLTSVKSYLFTQCANLASVVIHDDVTSIGEGTFSGCTSLGNVVIPDSVSSIGKFAFFGCSGLQSVTIGSGVKKIDGFAFDNCDIPLVISKIEEPFNIETHTFTYNTYFNATLYVPEGTAKKYKSKTGWQNFLFIEEGVPAGISQAESRKPEIVHRYTLGGIRESTRGKGIQIIQMDDGTTRKVLLK